MALTDKEKRFVDEYPIDCNLTKAAERAGFSKKTAGQIGYQLLKKPEIQEALAKKFAELSKRTRITAEKNLRDIVRIRQRCMQAVRARDSFGQIIEGEWTFDAKNALKACELIGKHLGMFTLNHKHDLSKETLEALVAASRAPE